VNPTLRRPVKRLFQSRLVGLPPEPEDTPNPVNTQEPAPVMEAVPKKPGPKPKYGIAMTPAERQRQSRANRKQKQDDAERRKLVAKNLKIARRNMSAPGGAITVVREHDIQAANRKYIRTLHDGLLRLSMDELRLSLESLKTTPDSHGRLHGERSGEGEREHGQSDIERLLAAKQHDASYFEDEDQDPNLAEGFKVKPEGAAPESFDTGDSTMDVADKPSTNNGQRISTETWEKQKKTDEKMLALVHEAFDESGHCHVPNWCRYDRTPCSFRANNSDEALEHLWAEYYAGEKLWDKVHEFEDPEIANMVGFETMIQPILIEARKRAVANVHHYVIREWLAKYKKQRGEPELRDKQFQVLPVDDKPYVIN
jgi:hypothetical protein